MSVLDRLFREQRLRDAVRRVLNPENPDGRVLVAALAEFCHHRRSSVLVSPQTGCVDPVAMGVAEGRREVFLWLLQKASIDDAELDAAIKREVMNG